MDAVNNFINRYLTDRIKTDLSYNKSILLLGPRQVGKSTLIRDILGISYPFDSILLQNPIQFRGGFLAFADIYFGRH